MRQFFAALLLLLFVVAGARATKAQPPAIRIDDPKRLREEIAGVEEQVKELNVRLKYLRERLAKAEGSPLGLPQRQTPGLRFPDSVERAMLQEGVRSTSVRPREGTFEILPQGSRGSFENFPQNRAPPLSPRRK